ncbi:hypothetical protein [Guptibacillus algicola]|uniref:hypothetical protein n=1 Tax=Guptibacillus algicola TaxID=225844 RepID=UPI001CD64759|nr:hypothetical protein [Alkalihalobacillus algicola]MCA0987324.1 hypothetical protein [Alkalihalobacillus algicola]
MTAILLIIFLPFVVSMFFLHNFWWFVVFIVSMQLFFLFLGLVAIFLRRQNLYTNVSPLKLLFSRIVCICMAIGVLSFGGPLSINLLKDAPMHYRGNYLPIIGKARLETRNVRGGKSQSLEINDTKYISFYILDEKYNGRFIEVHYLPHSKYVVDIWTRN